MTAIFGSGVSAVYQFQSVFSTFPTSGVWYPLSAYDRSDGETGAVEADELLGRNYHNNRDPVSSAPGLPDGGGQVIVPVCLREFGFWMSSLWGAPVTSGSGPNYTHVFESGKDALPFLAQQKKLATGLYKNTRGLLVNTLAFSLQKEAGFPKATLGTVLRDEATATALVTGTVASPFDLLRVPAAKTFVTRNGAASPVTALTFNYSNNAERFDPLNGTEYPDGYDPGAPTISGSFTVRYEDKTYDDLADARTGQPWAFGWTIDANKSLSIVLNNAIIAKAPTPVSSRGRLSKTYNFSIEQTDAASAVTATLKNDVAGYPPPPPPPPPP